MKKILIISLLIISLFSKESKMCENDIMSPTQSQMYSDLLIKTAKRNLEIIDADTGKNIPCLVRITDEKKGVLKIEGLYNRGTGLRRSHPASQWYCHDGQSKIKGIFGNLKIEYNPSRHCLELKSLKYYLKIILKRKNKNRNC